MSIRVSSISLIKLCHWSDWKLTRPGRLLRGPTVLFQIHRSSGPKPSILLLKQWPCKLIKDHEAESIFSHPPHLKKVLFRPAVAWKETVWVSVMKEEELLRTIHLCQIDSHTIGPIVVCRWEEASQSYMYYLVRLSFRNKIDGESVSSIRCRTSRP